MTTIYSYGSVDVTVPSGEKIAVYSRSAAKLYKRVGYPNYPDTWALLATTTAGTEYLSAAMSAETLVRIEAGPSEAHYEVGSAPSIFEPLADQSFADATGLIQGLAAAQGGSVEYKGGTSSTSANAGGAAKLTGGQPGATGVGGAAVIAGGAGGSTSGAGGAATVNGGAGTAGNGSGGNVDIEGGAPNGTGKKGMVRIRGVQTIAQGNPTAKTTAATLTIAELLTGIITGTHAAGATQAYTLPTGTLTDAGVQMAVGDAFDWVLINLSAAAVDTVTLGAGADHTIVGNPIVQSAHSSTGGIYGNSAQFRTRKTAANTFVTYRIA